MFIKATENTHKLFFNFKKVYHVMYQSDLIRLKKNSTQWLMKYNGPLSSSEATFLILKIFFCFSPSDDLLQIFCFY